MKLAIVVSVALIAFAGEASAKRAVVPCAPGDQVTGTALSTLLTGMTACASKVNGDKWQEEHRAGGALWDYKKGAADKVDPTAKVGGWSIVGAGSNTTVKYSYTGGDVYSYTVHSVGDGTYDFCVSPGSTFDVNVTLKSVGSGCGF